MITLRIIVILAIGYLLGSLNGAVLLSKILMHEDVREKGSGNAGFTNFMRNYGKGKAMLVLVIDILKTVAGCIIGGLLLPEMPICGRLLGGIGVQIGHILPLYFHFHGGKGFICGMAAILCADWRVFLVSLAILFAVTLMTKYVSLGSILSSVSYTVMFAILYNDQFYVFLLSLAMMLTVVLLHRSNIKSLVRGTERKTYFFSKESKS